MNNKFNNSNASDRPMIIKKTDLSGKVTFIATYIPAIDTFNAKVQARRTPKLFRNYDLVTENEMFESRNCPEQVLINIAKTGNIPAGCFESKDTPFMRELFDIFSQKR